MSWVEIKSYNTPAMLKVKACDEYFGEGGRLCHGVRTGSNGRDVFVKWP